MTDFKLHDADTAPEGSKPLLKKSKDDFGMIPNLHAVFAEAPGALEAYQKLHQLVLDSSFNAEEKTVLWQTISVENGCRYCVAAHSGIARSMKVSEELDDALRDEQPLPDKKLEALRDFVLAVMRKRGEVSDKDLKAFFDAGYENRQVLEVMLGLAQKTLSNYTNHIAKTPVDKPFQDFKWEKK